MDNIFPEKFISSQKHLPLTDVNLIEFYDDFNNSVESVRKAFKQEKEMTMSPFTDEQRIEEFESKLTKVNPSFLADYPTYIPFIRIR